MSRTKGANSFNPDLDQVVKLYSMGCSDNEVAAFFKVSLKTITRRKNTPEFQEAMEQGIGLGRLSLRRKQYETALAGNIPMLIWLGKNRLDQKEKQEIDNKSSDGSMSPSKQSDAVLDALKKKHAS